MTISKLRKYEVTYKNGNKVIMRAYNMYIENGTVYQLISGIMQSNTQIANCFSAENIKSIRAVE